MFIAMVVIFVIGYAAIALEHPLSINKAATALITGVLLWSIYALFTAEILALGASPTWLSTQAMSANINDWIKPNLDPGEYFSNWLGMADLATNQGHFILHELRHHIAEISEILFFLLGAMTIVETVDQYHGFRVITDRITTRSKLRLLWILSILAFFMSAALDNLTATIVMVALLRKLIDDRATRWFYASMVVLAANAGGAWSPIGDVTTIMLWVKGNVTTVPIIRDLIVPSIIAMVVPLVVLSFSFKGKLPPVDTSKHDDHEFTTEKERLFILILGVSGLLFVPIFKTVTHMPPFLGMLLSLGVIWLTTEILLYRKEAEVRDQLSVITILRRIDVPTIFFFLGILSAVAALQSAGHLFLLADALDEWTGRDIYLINIVIGILSAIVDNVPLVAGAMGMYDLASVGTATGAALDYIPDGQFWQLLAYCAGTGGSILIVGSAAGVAAMGMERIDFIWYMKKISWLALVGYFSGVLTYYLMFTF